MVDLVRAVLNGERMSRFFTNTCLVLIPKLEHPQSFTDFRPISLSNVTQRLVSKVLNDRLSKLLSNIISPNQSGFIKERSIGEYVLLAQEIIHGIRKPNKGDNVEIKLDMHKAYDILLGLFYALSCGRWGLQKIESISPEI